MLAPHIKKTIDRLWDRFWAAGITNPLVAVEQITYLLFLKRLESIDAKRQLGGLPSVYAENGGERCKWSYVRRHEKTNVKHLIDVVFPWLRTLEAAIAQHGAQDSTADSGGRMSDAYCQLDPNKGQVLSEAIDLIDELFARAGESSAAQDVMGDAFEYLLSEIATAGKNGQFRTPRHLIRFMVELIDPKPGERIIDPAAGTGGFLFSTRQYLLRKATSNEKLRVEWDGTFHRLAAVGADDGTVLVGLDSDRTMARIGWMNLILHGLANPLVFQTDSLSERSGKPAALAALLEPESYDVVLANPPFTGTVDGADVDDDPLRFPKGKRRLALEDGTRKALALTDKSELLFCWLMLDLLDLDGRCAVIVPEGVLFGNSDAHKSLRRELLTQHLVEAVVSLPSGAFQPYTGVKTSILVFRKKTRRERKQPSTDREPITRRVWFYEVSADGYSRDAKRREQPFGNNDLWDALEKFRFWSQGAAGHDTSYFQPRRARERWRVVQMRNAEGSLTALGEAFGDSPDVQAWEGKVAAIHELFPKLPADPEQATEQVRSEQRARLIDLVVRHFAPTTQSVLQKWRSDPRFDGEAAFAEWRQRIKKAQDLLSKACREAYRLFEPEDAPGLPLWKQAVVDAMSAGLAECERMIRSTRISALESQPPLGNLQHAIDGIAREFAKLDGFDVVLRSVEVQCQPETLDQAKHWVVPVRAYANGSLDPDCIEARDWSLSASQYKPFGFTQLRRDKSAAELIAALQTAELTIVQGLDKLQMLVSPRE